MSIVHTISSKSIKRPLNSVDERRRQEALKEYDTILEELRKSFFERWKQNIMANQVGRLDDFDFHRTLGTGAFGRVILVKHKNDHTYHAMKIMSKAKIVNKKQVEHTHNEKHILESLHFPFVVFLQYCYKDNSFIYILLPFINGGEMFTHLRKMGKFDESLSRFYAAQVTLVLEYLHKCSLVYRDLKPENILIDQWGYIRVTDFGFCKLIDNREDGENNFCFHHIYNQTKIISSHRTWTLCGTPEYLAPEIILSRGYGKCVDWWSFGVLIYEMNAGYSPFLSHNPVKIYEKITMGKYRCPTFFSEDLRHLLKNLLQVDLTRRYGNLKDGPKDIKNHSWFQKTDWLKIYNKAVVPSFIPICKSAWDDSNFDKYDEEPLDISKENLYAKDFENF